MGSIVGLVNKTRNIKRKLMRFLNWHPGWSFMCPWRADVGTGDEALKEKPTQTLGKDDERIWPQSNITKIMEC